jgi:hypothetical protein
MTLPSAEELQRMKAANQASRPGPLRLPHGSLVRFKITSCVEKISRSSGDAMLEVSTKLIDLEGRPKFKFYIMTEGRGSFKFQPFLTCIRYLPNDEDPESYEPESLVGKSGVVRLKDEVYSGSIRSGIHYFVDPADVDNDKLLIGKIPEIAGNGQSESAQSVDQEVRASVAEKLGVDQDEDDEIPGAETSAKPESAAKVKSLLQTLKEKGKAAKG